MSGGVRYWNEETQRWEDTDGTGDTSASVTPPPPARPAFAPGDEGAAGGPAGGPAGGAGEVSASGQSGAGAAGAGASSAVSAEGSSAAAPAGWPGAGGHGGRHGPAATDTVGSPDAGGPAWSATEVTGNGSASAGQEAGAHGAWPPAQWPGAAWPPADQPPAPAPARGMSRRLVWSVLTGAAVVGVAVSLVLTLVVGKDDEDKPSAAASGSPSSPSAGVSQQTGPSPTPTGQTVSPSVPAPELPAGYESYEDTEGFRIARPAGWSRTTVESQYGIAVVSYRSADGERRLQVYQVAEESPDASFDLYLSDRTPKPDGFRQLSFKDLDDGTFTGSRLEYLADSLKGEPDVGTWHVYDERFVAEDGNIYAIAAYGPDSDGREDELELLTTALDHFCPPYACDPAAID
ncbi:hypothetical protein ACWD0J_05430 [Streptomyces sp. NPDC003011]